MGAPVLGSIKAKAVFDSDKFEFPFSYNSNKYRVIVYFRNINTIELEDSRLFIKKFDGEYIVDGIKFLFTVSVCKECYYHSQTIDQYWCAASYQNI